ncbi:MAG: hypothetical protein JO057_06865, partial [Chloroflexi bacterium]|nr:hypothetical protein [Chloroflexota bacterium]
VYASAAGVLDPTQAPLVAGTLRAGLAFAVLLVPTALMGATLPLAVRGLRAARTADSAVQVSRDDAWTMGLLYATNTCGAIVGCLVSGFVLIGSLGLSETIVCAAGANTLAGLGGLIVDRLHPAARRQPSAPHPPAAHAAADNRASALGRSAGDAHAADNRASASGSPDGDVQAADEGARPRTSAYAVAALLAFSVSGAVSLAYEVVWSRILAVLFDSSIYGFVLMLATVLAGIALGGGLGALLMRWQSSARLAATTFGLLEIGIGVAAVAALLTFGFAFDLLSTIRANGPLFLTRFVRTDLRLMATLCVLTVLPAALLMGATFPVAARLWAAGSTALGRRLGGVYAGNVAGAIVGSLAGGLSWSRSSARITRCWFWRR